jgi:hypothetical protein
MTSDSIFNNNNPPGCMPHMPLVPERFIAPSPFRLDEGYSEDPRTPTGSEVTMGDADLMTIDSDESRSGQHLAARQWLLSQPAEFRSSKNQEVPCIKVILI